MMAVKNAPALSAMKILVMQYSRYGCRRIRIFARREGHAMSIDCCRRLLQQLALQVCRKRPRQRVITRTDRQQLPTSRNHVKTCDFVFGAFANGLQLQCLTIIDERTRKHLTSEGAGSIRSRRVVNVLARLTIVHGLRFLHDDTRPEFVSRAILDWIVNLDVDTAT